eukprot:COSAG01_NODE_23103_length_827_cov_1.050754_2_plen_223_part_00
MCVLAELDLAERRHSCACINSTIQMLARECSVCPCPTARRRTGALARAASTATASPWSSVGPAPVPPPTRRRPASRVRVSWAGRPGVRACVCVCVCSSSQQRHHVPVPQRALGRRAGGVTGKSRVLSQLSSSCAVLPSPAGHARRGRRAAAGREGRERKTNKTNKTKGASPLAVDTRARTRACTGQSRHGTQNHRQALRTSAGHVACPGVSILSCLSRTGVA